MQKFIIALLTLGLAISIGCDDPEATEEEPDLEAEEQVEEELEHEEEHDHDHAHDEADDAEEAAQAEDGKIAITATASTFEPSNIEAPAGEELILEFTREVDEGCMTEVVFPDLDIEEELPVDETVAVSITPEEGEAIGFECGMGMGQSTVTGI